MRGIFGRKQNRETEDKDKKKKDSVKAEKPGQKLPGTGFRIAGLPLPLYFAVLALVAVCMYAGCLPRGLVGSLILLMVLGEGLNAVGNTVPVVKTYLGGSVICILGAAVLQAAGVFTQDAYEMMDSFVNQEGFLVFYISALITGSLFNIDRSCFPQRQWLWQPGWPQPGFSGWLWETPFWRESCLLESP